MHQQKLGGKSWLKICSSRWDCSPPPPPQSRKLDWIRKEKIFIFFTQKINWGKKKKLATYYWIQSHTYTKIWWSYEVLCWSCSECSSRWGLQWVQLKVGLQSDAKVGNWTGFAKKNFSFFSLRQSTEKKALHITEYSHTLILRSDEVMKFCVEAAVSVAQGGTAVSAAQGGTAVRPSTPHPQVGNWTGFMKKKIHFFTPKINWKKNFVTGKVRLLAPKPTHLVWIFHTQEII